MDYEKIFISKGLYGKIVYSKDANIIMSIDEYLKNKNNLLNTSVYGTLKDLIEKKPVIE